MLSKGERVYIGKKHASEMAYTSVKGKHGTITNSIRLSINGVQTQCYYVLMDEAPQGYEWIIHHEDVLPLKPEHLGNYTNEDVLCILEDKEPF